MNTDQSLDSIKEHLARMGEPPSSVEYLTRTVYFNGKPVIVREPSRSFPATNTGD